MIKVVYGVGGFDTSKPNNNVIEIIEIPYPDEGEVNEQES